MKHLLLALMVCLLAVSCKQAEKPTAINIGTVDSLFSKTLNEQRKVWVHVPESFKKSPGTKYPVVYLLDGDGHFYSVVGLIHQLSSNTRCPEMIVVGIPNTDRTRDLTPTHVKKVFGDTTFSKTSGGGENFTRFIADELIPYIDSHYPTTPYRTMIGHSLGGLMSVNTIVHHPDIFANYLAIDPSMWWDARKLSNESEAIFKEKKLSNKFLYVAVANTMRDGMQLSDLAKDTTETTEHIRSILEFCERTKAQAGSGLTFASQYYADDDHGSVPLIAEYDALRAMFSWYALKGLDVYFDPKANKSASDLVDLLNSHYKSVSTHFGYETLPPEEMVNGLGYGFMSNNMAEKALAMFDLNLNNYPKSSNAHDSMGDYFLNQKDTASAIDQFNEALAIAEVSATREKLNKLKKK